MPYYCQDDLPPPAIQFLSWRTPKVVAQRQNRCPLLAGLGAMASAARLRKQMYLPRPDIFAPNGNVASYV